MNEQQQSTKDVGEVIAIVYGIGSMIAFMYFSWQFAQQNGFLAWLLLGMLVPAIKAAVWPIWFFVG